VNLTDNSITVVESSKSCFV